MLLIDQDDIYKIKMCLQFDKEKKIQQENGFEKTVQHFPFLLKSNVS